MPSWFLVHVLPGAVPWFLKRGVYHPSHSWMSLAYRFLLFALIVPSFEEPVFRGLLLPRAVSRWGLVRGTLVVSVGFAILHPNVVTAFLFGVVLAILYLAEPGDPDCHARGVQFLCRLGGALPCVGALGARYERASVQPGFPAVRDRLVHRVLCADRALDGVPSQDASASRRDPGGWRGARGIG